MVERLIASLLGCPEVTQIILTRNIPEELNVGTNALIEVIDNDVPIGFGGNHNAAFALCRQPYFCALNPDIELSGNPFPKLVTALERNGSALVAPLVVSPDGGIEDSMRHFPTVRLLLIKAIAGGDGRYQVNRGQPNFFPEWVAGMFMLFRSDDFARLKGFDEGFFLYYEDVDICVRAWRWGMKVLGCPQVSVIHDARRESRRSMRYLRLHLASMGRYFWKHWGRLPRVPDYREVT